MNCKQCPFCGGSATIDIVCKSAGMDGMYKDWRIKCDECGAQLYRPADSFYGRKAYTREEVIEVWNRRISE